VERETYRLTAVLKTLANEHRLLILCELIDGPKTVTALCAHVPGISQSGVSQHLALLKAHGVVACEKSGQSVTYAIADERVRAVIAVLKREYCQPPAP
jgi:DNA-binding transcriptional ArsR family regulator